MVKNQRSAVINNLKIKRMIGQMSYGDIYMMVDVSAKEVNALIYRICKKLPGNLCIEDIRGRVYILAF
jgi:hypothetical protein